MLIVGNQKNYMTINEVNDFLKNSNDLNNCVICPSNIFLPYYLKRNFIVGIQNIEVSDKTVTGDITSKQAKSIGVKCTILGHSERRENYEENLSNKIIDALNNDLKVILCVGETENEKNNYKTNEVIKNELNDLISINDLSNVIIAYEPRWAIGTGLVPTNEDIENIISYIKNVIKDSHNYDIKVLYGGSVNKDNVFLLKTINNLDGFLIGKASTNIEEFKQIIEVANN